MPKEVKPKSVFINQLDGGYTINLQGNTFYPVKVAVTLDEVKTIIDNFFNTAEIPTIDATQTSTNSAAEGQGEDLLS